MTLNGDTEKGTLAERREVPFSASESARLSRARAFLNRHPRIGDGAAVAVYVLTGLPQTISGLEQGDPWAVVILLSGAIALAFRRRRPVVVVVILVVAQVLGASFGPGNIYSVGVWAALYAVGASHRQRFALTAAVLASVPVFALSSAYIPQEFAQQVTFGRLPTYNGLVSGLALVLANTVATGAVINARRTRQRREDLARWAADTALLAAVEERTRIAREMHDIVAHSLSIVIALADGAATAMHSDPAQAEVALRELSGVGRTAQTDLRRVLGVLKDKDDDSGAAPLSPSPGESSLRPLLEGFRTAGLPLRHRMTGPPLPTDDSFHLAIYRILQEALTNALRYAHDASLVLVTVVSETNRVTLTVTDDGRTDEKGGQSVGFGRGLTGMRERAALYAGTVTYGPRAAGGWIVEAVLLLPEWPS